MALIAPAQVDPRTGIPARRSMFGLSVCALDDWNGDGAPELAIGDPACLVGRGEVWIVSTVDWQPIAKLPGGVLRTVNFGVSLAAPGDLDGDGVGDLLVGTMPDYGNDVTGEVRAHVVAYSSRTREPLHVLVLPSMPHGGVGYASSDSWPDLCGLGDVDGDAVPDFAIGLPYDCTEGRDRGKVVIAAGRTGETIREVLGEVDHGSFGFRLARVPDVDEDGVDELAVTSCSAATWVWEDEWEHPTGRLHLLSGRSGESIAEWSDPDASPCFGRSVVARAGARGERVEILVGRAFTWTHPARVFAYSIGSNQPTRRWDAPPPSSFQGYERNFGARVLPVDDFDGDGHGDLIATMPFSFGDEVSVSLLSGADDRILAKFGRPSAETSHFGVGICTLPPAAAGEPPRLVVGAASFRGSVSFPGVVEVLSLPGGETLARFARPTSWEPPARPDGEALPSTDRAREPEDAGETKGAGGR